MLPWLKRLCSRPEPALTVQQTSGGQGERLAAKVLQDEHGFAILARNWRNPRDLRDELDLVCRDGEILVFVEVKTRVETALVAGYYAVDKRKKKALLRACRAYLRLLPIADRPATIRFDVVEVSTSIGGRHKVLHFENVPLFPKHE